MARNTMNASIRPPAISPARAAASRSRAWRSLLVGTGIVAAHAVIALLLLKNTEHIRVDRERALPIVAEILDLQPSSFLSLNPELEPADSAVVLTMPTLPTELADTELSLLPPMIDPGIDMDVSAYNARAYLPPGVVATIILQLEIAPDGSVTSAKIVSRSAEESANEAALAYALATQWLPGRVDGKPTAMQASLTVILGERA